MSKIHILYEKLPDVSFPTSLLFAYTKERTALAVGQSLNSLTDNRFGLSSFSVEEWLELTEKNSVNIEE
jgi:hypothetical protein